MTTPTNSPQRNNDRRGVLAPTTPAHTRRTLHTPPGPNRRSRPHQTVTGPTTTDLQGGSPVSVAQFFSSERHFGRLLDFSNLDLDFSNLDLDFSNLDNDSNNRLQPPPTFDLR